MESKFKFHITKRAQAHWHLISKSQHDDALLHRVSQILTIMQKNPFDPDLSTRRVQGRGTKIYWATPITSDLNLIWDFNKKKDGIIILIIG